MTISFVKYHGCGNDFIMVDDRTQSFPIDTSLVKAMCDRHFGIGADGLILLQHAEGYDFRMVYFNSDGRESSMCGNGGRCIAAFARHLGLSNSDHLRFIATDGEHEAYILASEGDNTLVKLKMQDVANFEVINNHATIYTGSPHFILEAPELDNMDIVAEGRKIRYHENFAPGGVNVNFLEFAPSSFRIRTYERGVEDETLACGTGVTASALYAHARFPDKYISPVTAQTKGGDLHVYFEPSPNGYHQIWLEGPATYVFEGEINEKR